MNLLDLMVKIGIDDQVTSKIGGIAKGIKSGLGTAAKAGAAAITAASAAMVGFGVKAVQTGMGFDAAMSQVAATMGKTTEEITNLRDFAQEMGSTTAFSATQAAEALNYMALAGYDADTSMAMLPTVLNLAAAGNIELASASDMVTDAQSALGLTLDQTSQMVDQMAKASSKSNTSVEQLGSAFLTVGGTAKALSGGTVELSTALGVLADNGIKGSEGGTALRNVLMAIQGDKFEETFGALGVSAYDADGNLRPLNETLKDMSDAIDGMSQEERTNIISDTFNARDLKSVEALLSNCTDRWDELTDAISDSEGAAAAMAETQLDNLQGDVTLLKSAFEGFQIAVSDSVTPALREFVKFGSDALSEMTAAFKEGGIEQLQEVFSEKLSEALTMAVQAIPGIMQAGAALVSSLAQAVIKAVPQLGAAAYQTVGGIIDMIRTHLPDIMAAGGEFIMGLGTAIVQNAPQILADLLGLLVEIVGYIIQHIPDMFAAAGELFGQLVEAIGEVDIVQEIGSAIQGAIDSLGEFVGGFFDAGARLIGGLIDGILSAIGGIGDAMMQATNEADAYMPHSPAKKGAFSGRGWTLYSGRSIMQALAQGIEDNAPLASNAMKNAVSGLQSALKAPLSYSAGTFTSSGELGPYRAFEGGNTYIVQNLEYMPGTAVAQHVQELFEDVGRELRMVPNGS